MKFNLCLLLFFSFGCGSSRINIPFFHGDPKRPADAHRYDGTLAIEISIHDPESSKGHRLVLIDGHGEGDRLGPDDANGIPTGWCFSQPFRCPTKSMVVQAGVGTYHFELQTYSDVHAAFAFLDANDNGTFDPGELFGIPIEGRITVPAHGTATEHLTLDRTLPK